MYITLNNTYTSVEVALCTQGTIINVLCIDKYEASGQLIVALDTLCMQAKITLADITCIVTQAGPGPFATLRSVLATANGLAAATNIKLVSVDGLRTFIDEHRNQDYPITMALLNAYSNDVYYAIEHDKQITTGIAYGSESLTKIIDEVPATLIRFIGNGVMLHEKTIHETCGMRAYIPTVIPETCSVQAVAYQGWQQWIAQEHITDQLAPLYLKAYSAPGIMRL